MLKSIKKNTPFLYGSFRTTLKCNFTEVRKNYMLLMPSMNLIQNKPFAQANIYGADHLFTISSMCYRLRKPVQDSKLLARKLKSIEF